jgi:Predicted membrane protein
MSSFFSQIKGIANFSNDIDIQKAENHIISSIDFKGANIWILIFAIVIASVGLNVNSIPVVIGAMLISPLMGPIMGIGLALGINDTVLLKRSFKNFLIMTIISIIASSLFFFVSPLSLETPTELLARTNPTIYDVFIALFGGLAVIVEVCKREKGTVIAGAAIATALMPPLCTAGYGLASGKLVYFIGAFYLYFINSVFIALATFLMVRYMNFPFVKINDPVKQKKFIELLQFLRLY